MDSTFIIIDSMERLLSQLKDIESKEVPSDVMSQLNKLYEKFGYLLSYWEIHNKIDSIVYKIKDSLWMNNYVMKFLFEDYIVYITNNRNRIKNLFCTICNTGFPIDPNILRQHLIDPRHMTNFIDIKRRINDFVWNEAIFYKYAFEKFIEFRVDNMLYCKICAYTIPSNHTSLVGHLDSKKHKKNFEDIMTFKFSCERNVSTAAINKREQVFGKRSVPVSNPLHQEGASSAYTSATYQRSASKTFENVKQLADDKSIRDVNGRKVRSSIGKSDFMSSLHSDISSDKYDKGNASLSGVLGSMTDEGRRDSVSEKSFGASPRNPNKKGPVHENYKKAEVKKKKKKDDKVFEKQKEKKFDKPYYWYGIAGVPPDVTEDDIKQGFSCFGVINRVQFLKPNNVNVQVNVRNELKKCMEDIATVGVDVSIKGRKYILKERIPMVVDFPDKVKLDFCKCRKSFFETLLFDAVKESESSFTLFNNKLLKTKFVEDEIRNILKLKYSNNLKVITIGSRATGLANNSSLHDIFIDIGNYYEDESSNLDKLAERVKDIKKQLESSEYTSFKNIKIDGRFLLADHVITKMRCKIFCGSGMVVENTELIRSYVSADDIVKSLIIVIREWIKFTDLSGLLSNYSITWMVLFYLMQPSVNYIKPVVVLKSTHQEPLKSISGWDCGFSNIDDPSFVIWPHRKILPVKELLLKFFKFYSISQLNKNVLCPLTSEMVSKTKFEAKSLPSSSFSKYISQEKKMNVTHGICLQDPLEHDKNLTEGIIGDFKHKLKLYCEKMVDMISSES